MPLWKKLWLLFTVIWVVVCALSAGTIFFLSEEEGKAAQPAVLAVTVPALTYLIAWLWYRWRKSAAGNEK